MWRNEIKNLISKNKLQSIFFCIGLSLTIWRSCECLEKYLHDNLATKVFVVENHKTTLPSLVVCVNSHHLSSPYNER